MLSGTAKAAFRTWAPKCTLETAAAFRPCPRSLNLRCFCLSRHPDHCAWFEECDASALWLGPIDVGDGFMYTTYEVWGRAETV